MRGDSIPDELLRGASGEAVIGRGPATSRLVTSLSDVPAEIVIAHELGHVLGLDHNRDSTTLMCGRPASCRPAAFASDSVRFFPLTVADEQRLRERWP